MSKIKKHYSSKMYIFILFFLILLNEEFFYLIDFSNYGTISTDIIYIFIILLILFMFNSIKRYNYKFKEFIIMFFFMLIISILITHFKFGQPIYLALLCYRYNLFFLAYFPICIIINHCNIAKLKDFLIKLSVLLCILFFIQVMFNNKIVIFHLDISERFDRARTFTGVSIILIGILLNFVNILYKKNIKYIIFFLVQIFYILYIVQTRSITICLFMTLIIALLISITKISLSKKIKIIGVILIGSLLLLPYIIPLYQSSIDDITNNSGNYHVRAIENEFYLNKLEESPIFGIGWYNTKYSGFYNIIGTDQGMYLSDIGIYGYLFEYGYVGLFIYIYLFLKMLILSIKIYRIDKPDGLFFLMYIMFTNFMFQYSCVLNIPQSIIYLMLIMSLIENKYKSIYNNSILIDLLEIKGHDQKSKIKNK